MHVEQIRTPGLGDSTYVVTHEGVAVVVDPQRDVDRFLAVLEASDAELRLVLETHLHNDYVSGGRDLARRTGSRLVVPAAGAVAWTEYLPAFHGEDLPVGPFAIRPIHTPGHTPEHMSYLLVADGLPLALFSGGSLLVGSFGRPDLLGVDRARGLAKLQFLTMRRLAALPDDVRLYPTHGEGSFCAASGAGATTSTIGRERRENPLMALEDERAFTEALLAPLEPWPAYYRHMGSTNLAGPTPAPPFAAPRLDPVAVPADVVLLDVRPRAAFAASHVAGSHGIEFSDRVGVWAGWLLPFDAPLVLVAEPNQDVAEIVRQLARIGFDHTLGVVTDVAGLAARRGPLRRNGLVPARDVAARLAAGDRLQLLDVRAPGERRAAHVPGSAWRYLPELATDGPPEDLDPRREVYVVCATGYRAHLSVGLLEAAGHSPVVVTDGGTTAILAELDRLAARR